MFKEVLERNAEYKKERENTMVSLVLENELEERAEIKENSKEFKRLFTPSEYLTFKSLQQFKVEEEEDVKLEKKERWEKQLKEDFYLDEAIKIMEDML